MTPIEEKALKHVMELLEATGIPLYSASCNPGNSNAENYMAMGRDTVKQISEAQEKISAAKGWIATLIAK